MQFDDNLLMGTPVPGGPVVADLQAGNDASGSSPMMKGVGPLGRVFMYTIVPAAPGAAVLAAAQQLAGAGNLTLTAGAGVTLVTVNGQSRYQFDVPRAVSLSSTGNLSGINFTISGYDIYGQAMTQLRAGPNNNTVNTLKAFWQVTQIAASAAVGTDVTAGTANIYGLPIIVSDAGYLSRVGWAETLAEDAGTFVAAVATDPATNATGDVRGTYTPSSAANGTRRLVVGILLPSSVFNTNRAGAFGVTQA